MDECFDTLPWSISIKQSACQGPACFEEGSVGEFMALLWRWGRCFQVHQPIQTHKHMYGYITSEGLWVIPWRFTITVTMADIRWAVPPAMNENKESLANVAAVWQISPINWGKVQKLVPKCNTNPQAPHQALPFSSGPSKSLSRQPGCTLLSPTINWDNKFNRTSELHDMREKEKERTFRQSAINSSNMEGKPLRPKQMKRGISPLFWICVVWASAGMNWFLQLQVLS